MEIEYSQESNNE
jgi:hypothetical protein